MSRLRADERGSTLLAALLIMVLVQTLALAALARTLSWMSQLRRGQNHDAALGVADAAITDALVRLRTHDPDPPTLTGSGSAGGGNYQYTAARQADGSYEFLAKGTVGNSAQGISARLSRGMPHTLFADDDLVVGAGLLDVYTFASLGGSPTGQATVASNGRIVVEAGADAGDAQHVYGGGGVSACIQCPNPVVHEDAYELPPVVAPAAHSGCPLFGVFTVDHVSGTYVCDEDVTLTGTILPTSRLEIYVMGDHALDLSTAVINPLGDACNVRIYKESGTGDINLGTASTIGSVSFSGLLYAPESRLTVAGSKWWTGSVVAREVRLESAVLKLGWDVDGSDCPLGGEWTMSRYTQIPSSEVP